jgi:predicted oxidoreductase
MSRPLPITGHGLQVGPLVYGCMGLGGEWNRSPLDAAALRHAQAAVEAALESGITMFDLADIYMMGKAEEVFGRVLAGSPGLRERIIVQTKVGIRFKDAEGPGRYDFSRAWVSDAIEACLRRLGVETIDILLLHRPDPLVEPGELAEVLEGFRTSGKVRYFGVSNMGAAQIDLIEGVLDHPFIVNQLDLSLGERRFVEVGATVNDAQAPTGAGMTGTVEFCRKKGIQLQAWSPLAKGKYSGRDALLVDAADRETAALVARMAAERGTTREAIVLAWLLRHPAGIQAVIGTSEPNRIRACADAADIELSREEWYALFVSARGAALP